MAVSQTLNNLFEQTLCDILLQPPPSPDVVEEISSRAELDNEKYVLFCFEIFVKSYNVLVTSFFEHNYFLHNFLGLGLIREELLVYALDGADTLGQLVDG